MTNEDDQISNGRFLTEEDIANRASSFTIPSRMAKAAHQHQQKSPKPLPEPDPSLPAPVRHQFRPTSKPKARS